MVQDLRRERDVTITMLQGMMISQTETAIDRAIGGMKVVRRIGLALAVVRMFALVSQRSRPDLANAAVSLASSEVGRIQARSGPVPGRRRGDSDRSRGSDLPSRQGGRFAIPRRAFGPPRRPSRRSGR